MSWVEKVIMFWLAALLLTAATATTVVTIVVCFRAVFP